MKMTRAPATIAMALSLLVVGNLSRADECTKEQKATSKLHFDEGAKAFRLNNLQKAADAFKAAYDACPLPLFLYNLGQTYRQLKDNEQALYFYKQFLSSTDASDSRRHDVEEWTSQLKQQIETQKRIQEAPPPGPAAPAAAAAPSPNGDTTTIATRPVRRTWVKDPVPWIALGVGVAGVAVGAAFLGLAGHEGDLASNAADANMFALHHSNDLNDQKAGWPLLAIGAAGLVVGGIVIAIDLRKGR